MGDVLSVLLFANLEFVFYGGEYIIKLDLNDKGNESFIIKC